MNRRFVFGVGSGRCGTLTLSRVLSQQANVHVTHEARPLLPWRPQSDFRQLAEMMKQRIVGALQSRDEQIVGDVASFYLPYVEVVLAEMPSLRVVCLKRDREKVVASFGRWLDQVYPVAVNHWARQPAAGWCHDPLWSPIFPKYDTADRAEGIRRYWDEYYFEAERLATDYPQQFQIFETEAALNSETCLSELLEFVGIPREYQQLAVGQRYNLSR